MDHHIKYRLYIGFPFDLNDERVDDSITEFDPT